MRQQIGISSFRNGCEEVAGHRFAAGGESGGFDMLLGIFDDGRYLEESGCQIRVGPQDQGDQEAISAADIDDPGAPGERIGLHDGGVRA